MPTAEEYDELADAYDRLALDVAMLLVATHRSCDGSTLSGGRLTSSTLRAFDDDQVLCDKVAELLRSHRDECRRRSAVIRAYRSDYADYQVRYDRYLGDHRRWLAAAEEPSTIPGPAPRRPSVPTRPPSWATV